MHRSDFDALFHAQHQHHPGQLGDNATRDFVLRHVFGVAPELIKEPGDLLRVLLRRHYRGQAVPAIFDDRFMQLVRQQTRFQEWPLERIVPDAPFSAFCKNGGRILSGVGYDNMPTPTAKVRPPNSLLTQLWYIWARQICPSTMMMSECMSTTSFWKAV